MTMTQPLEHRMFDQPDEVLQGENWKLELLDLAGGTQPVVAIDWQGASVWARPA
jgi:hypothetical protein